MSLMSSKVKLSFCLQPYPKSQKGASIRKISAIDPAPEKRRSHTHKNFALVTLRLWAMDVFVQRKTAILNDLGSNEPDLSPKGRPDDEVLELLNLINSHEDYVSTSSCSGRAVVFLDAEKNGHGEEAKGRWLMNLHTPFAMKEDGFLSDELLYVMFFGDMQIGEDWNSKSHPSRLINLKFEPLVNLSVIVIDDRLYTYCAEISRLRVYFYTALQVSATENLAFRFQDPERPRRRSSSL